jgi:preprotein translocase subunit SecY
MLDKLANIFRIPDLRKRILFTLGMLFVYRLGGHLPTPGIDTAKLESFFTLGSTGGSLLGFVDLFSGGQLRRMTIFALGIMPYITASIILQLLTVVYEPLAKLQKEGELGRKKITQWTRYITVILSSVQSFGIAVGLEKGGFALNPGWGFRLMTMLTLTTGSAFIMWLGEQITDRGIGNGMSLLIFVGIAARIPSEGKQILDSRGGVIFAAVCVAALIIIVGVVFVEQGQRRIPVQYAKRMVGRRMYGGTSTYLPLKVNQAGVIPVIFASSLIYIPHLITQLVRSGTGGVGNSWWDKFVGTYLSDPSDPVYICIYFGLIIFFTYFYVSVTFNPDERADEMKKFGGFIPGIRPGKPTADYLRFVLSRITLPGSIYLGVIAVLPNLFLQIGASGGVQNLPFGGTAVLIMIGVGLDTVKQIESQLMQRNYEGFLK